LGDFSGKGTAIFIKNAYNAPLLALLAGHYQKIPFNGGLFEHISSQTYFPMRDKADSQLALCSLELLIILA